MNRFGTRYTENGPTHTLLVGGKLVPINDPEEQSRVFVIKQMHDLLGLSLMDAKALSYEWEQHRLAHVAHLLINHVWLPLYLWARPKYHALRRRIRGDAA